MKATILAVGDEILVGQITNTNATWISEKLSELGVQIIRHLSTADDLDDIQNAIKNSFQDSDLIIVTGGLGPTKDDITKKALAAYYQCGFTFSEETYQRIVKMFKKRNIPISQAHHDQCQMPVKARLLENKMGTAPGMWFESNGQQLISVPGVPYEMQYIMTHGVMPKIEELNKLIYRKKTIRTVGIGETSLAEIIEPLLKNHQVNIAYLPSPGGVRIRLSNKGISDPEQIETQLASAVEIVDHAIKSYIYGYDEQLLEAHIGELLRDKNLTIGTAESCTGGYLAHIITSIPGASAYYKGSVVAYSNDVKRDQLGVSYETLDTHGAVSRQTVTEMVKGAQDALGCSIAIATSGVSGPTGGTDEKPVGTVWIAVGDAQRTLAKKYLFSKDRVVNIKYTAVYALDMVRKFLNDR